MENKPLSQTNAHLRDPEKRRRALLRSVLSSSAVEGIHLTAQDVVSAQQAQDVRITHPVDSAR
jgi:Fic family protein